MPNAPQQPEDQTARAMTRLALYIGASAGARPTADDESDEWHVLRIERFAGGRMHRAELQRDLGAAGQHIQDRELAKQASRLVEIWTLDEEGERELPLFFGEFLQQSIRFDAAEEVERGTALLLPHHFQATSPTICEGMEVWDPANEEVFVQHWDLEFNPLVDDRIVHNRRDLDEDATGKDYALWIDPESGRTDEAAQQQGLFNADKVFEWTLFWALDTLQQMLNDTETYVKNAETRDDGNPLDPFSDDDPALEDVTLQRGHYLPTYLDALLPKYGFNWTLDVGEIEDDPDKAWPQIRFFKRGDGEEKTLPHQAVGEDFDPNETEALAVDILADISRLANFVTGHGSLEEREITIELHRAWTEDEDATALDSLNWETNGRTPDNNRIWRKWVANEAGDYNDLRPEITGPPDFSDVFSQYAPKRRPAEQPLTYFIDDKSGGRLPIGLQYMKSGVWVDYDDHDWRPLPTELGVHLTDPKAGGLVQILHDLGEDAAVRITCTIRGDVGPRKQIGLVGDSPSTERIELFLDLSNRFHDRSVVSSGEFASIYAGGAADERDDADALQDFIAKIADVEQAASIEAAVPLHGLLFDYAIGDVVTEIEGRGISLNRLAKDGSEPRYLQVLGIAWDVPQQQTILTVAPYDT